MENKTCSSCRYGEYYADKCDVWCSLFEKWVGLQGRRCKDWEWIAGETQNSQDSSC